MGVDKRNILRVHKLEPHVVDPSNLAPTLDVLEEAIAGQRAIAPLPIDDPGRAQLLRRSLRVGEEIEPEVALVVATSGSTGTPKGAMLTPLNLVSSADATHQFLGGEGAWLLAMPPHHIAGIQVLVRSLIAGIDPASVDVRGGFHVPTFATAAARLAEEADRRYTSLTPMQLLKAMDTLVGIEALRLFDAILVGGAPLRADDRRAARELGIRVVSTYGSSETSGGCVYDGRPIPGARVRIVDERIHLGGPMIARGYRNVPSDAFRDGWFVTSDTGYLDGGVLTVTGRLDTIIDSGGLKIHPEVLERRMTDLPSVKAACVVGVPDTRLGQAICAVYVGTAQPTDIIEALDDLPRWQLPKQILRVDSLPLTGPGKVDRRAVISLFDAT